MYSDGQIQPEQLCDAKKQIQCSPQQDDDRSGETARFLLSTTRCSESRVTRQSQRGSGAGRGPSEANEDR